MIELARSLADRADVEILGIGPGGKRQPAPPWVPPIPMHTTWVPQKLLYDVWHHSSLADPTRNLPDIDVVHATTATVPNPRDSALVVTLHDLFPLTTPEQFTKRGVRIMTTGISRARELAQIVCCPSSDTIDDCLQAGFAPEQLREVPWGVTVDPVSAERVATVRQHYGLDRPYVLWVGTIEPRKNLPLLLDAFAAIQPIEVDLVLVGPVGWHEQLEGHIDRIGSQVRQLGFVPSEHLSALYSGAEVLALPSLREGFGLPALEAMAHSTPVLCQARTAVSEVMGEGGIGMESPSVQEWADGLKTLLEDESLRSKLGEEALARARTFTWERSAERMVSAYRDAIDRAS